jgi:hypothetical protein
VGRIDDTVMKTPAAGQGWRPVTGKASKFLRTANVTPSVLPTSLRMSHQVANRKSAPAKADHQNHDQDQRRSESRIPCDRPISMMPLGDDGARDQFLAGQLIDCSAHGLGMTLTEPIETGKQVLVRLKLDRSVLLVYSIRYCIPVTPTQFRAGARFTDYSASSYQGDPAAIVKALSGTVG